MSSSGQDSKKLIIRPWPKMIFLWPTALICLILGIAALFTGPKDGEFPPINQVWGGIFLLVLTINLLVLTFEFPRATSLTVFIAIIAIVFLLVLLNQQFSIIEPLRNMIVGLKLYASASFYLAFFSVQFLLFVGMYAVTRFDYWELTPNELVHHHGLLGDTERFSTAGLKLNKEISDIFEYMIAGAGRVIMLIPGSPRPIILDNVLNIRTIEKLSDDILNARVVRLEHGGSSEPAEVGDENLPLHETETG